MDKKTWGFIIAALLVALALSAFVSPFASDKPDGLDKFSEDQKFAEQAQGKDAWTHAPLPKYKLSGIEHESVSTAVAGVIGTLVVFGLAFGLAKVVSRKSPSDPERNPAR